MATIKKLQIIGEFPSGGTVDPSEIERVVDDYLQSNPPAGEPGKDGADGFSPTVSIEETETGFKVLITDVNGIHSFEVLNGSDGKDGETGQKGDPGEVDYERVEQMVDSYLEENPPTPQITINGQGPDENGNFIINTQGGESTVTNNVVEF